MWYATFTIYYAGFVRCLPIAHCVFFFNDTATTEIYTLSLHDALPISPGARAGRERPLRGQGVRGPAGLLRLRRPLPVSDAHRLVRRDAARGDGVRHADGRGGQPRLPFGRGRGRRGAHRVEGRSQDLGGERDRVAGRPPAAC